MGGLDESIDEASREPAAMLQQFAESLRSTTDEVLRLMEENLNALASDPDRQERFGNDAVSDGPRLFQLENLVTNELWRNANDNPPINVEPVCYPTGCRLKLFFANTEELVAVASGALHLRMLFALREYGFGSAETKLDFRELDPETGPEVPAEAVDVFLWPKSDSRLQSEPSLSLG
jgi:hypothetical protein